MYKPVIANGVFVPSPSGGGGGLTVGTTTITGGTNGNILINNGGVVGEVLSTAAPNNATVAGTLAAYDTSGHLHAYNNFILSNASTVLQITPTTLLSTVSVSDNTTLNLSPNGTIRTFSLPPEAGTQVLAGRKTNTFTGLQTITQATADIGILASTGASFTQTAAIALVDLAATWTAGSVATTDGTYTGIKLNITNNSSNAASKLLDLQVGGVSKFSVFHDGAIRYGDGTYPIAFRGAYGDFTLTQFGDGSVVANNGFSASRIGPGDAANGAFLSFPAGVSHVLQQRYSTSPQQFGVFNTYTSDTNFESFVIDWKTTSNVCRIGTSKGGAGGTARDLVFEHGDLEVFRITDNNVDINSGFSLRIGGVQVVTSQQAGIYTANTAHSLTGGDSVALSTLESDMNALGTKINEIRAILNAHGLTTTV